MLKGGGALDDHPTYSLLQGLHTQPKLEPLSVGLLGEGAHTLILASAHLRRRSMEVSNYPNEKDCTKNVTYPQKPAKLLVFSEPQPGQFVSEGPRGNSYGWAVGPYYYKCILLYILYNIIYIAMYLYYNNA